MGEQPPPRRGTKALELWCRRVTEGYVDVKIDNMTTSWRDGLAFCAMIHHFRPDLINFEKLNKNDIFKNNDLAFRTAEEYLGIPALLEAGDMMAYEVPDRLSILTYLSQFYRVFGNQDTTSPDRDKFKIKSLSPVKDFKTAPTSASPDSPPTSFHRNRSPLPTNSTPKREQCFKCGLPVFLAERILFNNNFYHNSCFKCSRCDCQLVSGSLTNIQNSSSDKMTCRSCSDKEMGMLLFDDDFDGNDSKTSMEQNVYSFEQNFVEGKEIENDEAMTMVNLEKNDDVVDVLTKSVTDEEKRKSVKGYYARESNKSPNFKNLDEETLQDSDNDKNDRDNDDNEDNDESDDSNIINKSKFDDVVKNQNLSLKFATQLLLNVNNDNEISLDDNNIVEENLTPNKILINKETIDNCISSDPDDNNLEIKNNLENNFDESNEIETNKNIVDFELNKNDKETNLDKNCMDELKENDVTEINNEQICDQIMCFSNKPTTVNQDKSSINDEKEKLTNIPINISDSSNDKTNDSLNTELNKESYLVKNNDCDKEIDKLIETKNEIQIKTDEQLEVSIKIEVEKTNNPFEDDDNDHQNEDNKSKINNYPTNLNPFGDFDDNDAQEIENKINTVNAVKPKPKPRVSTNPFEDDEDDTETIDEIPVPMPRRTPVPTPRRSLATQSQSPFGSSQSINSIARHRKGKAPPPPVPSLATHPNLLSASACASTSTSPSTSLQSTPKMKKKRPAPTPPSVTPNKSVTSQKLQQPSPETSTPMTDSSCQISQRRVIPLDISLLDNEMPSNISEADNSSVYYRRKLIPTSMSEDDSGNLNFLSNSGKELSERQLEKLKDNKEAKNRNRKSTEIAASMLSDTSKWRHTKGPAPPLPISRISLKHELSNQEINHELEIIKVQQNGLEKQGVMLEKMIRNRSEEIDIDNIGESSSSSSKNNNSERDVEDLIMQLFEIVNEKNELFRRQAELLNLRRQYRLEQEQSELEYKIRLSMAQPERNKTDSDKEREDALIAHLVHVVQQRNEVIECFEMDRLREIEEDLSIKQSIELHSAKRDTKLNQQTLTKLSKKEKKKLKEAFKLTSHSKKNKIDADKDEDESEVKTVKPKKNKFIKFSIIK